MYTRIDVINRWAHCFPIADTCKEPSSPTTNSAAQKLLHNDCIRTYTQALEWNKRSWSIGYHPTYPTSHWTPFKVQRSCVGLPAPEWWFWWRKTICVGYHFNVHHCVWAGSSNFKWIKLVVSTLVVRPINHCSHETLALLSDLREKLVHRQRLVAMSLLWVICITIAAI